MHLTLYKIQQHSFKQVPTKSQVYAHKSCHHNPTSELICEELFAAWNNGSGHECEAFRTENRNHNFHSLSVDDVVILCDVDGKEKEHWLCESFGWEKITLSDLVKHDLKCRAKAHAFA
jgi:hypothetical protein